jgi:excisionase family DNA binding protein
LQLISLDVRASQMNPLLTVKEVAGILQVHPNTVYLKAQSGEIPSVRTSNFRIRFVEKEINEWLERRSRSSRFVLLLEEALRTDLSQESYDKLFLKGEAKMSPKGKTWNYPFGSVSLRLGKSGKDRWHIYYRVDGRRIRRSLVRIGPGAVSGAIINPGERPGAYPAGGRSSAR